MLKNAERFEDEIRREERKGRFQCAELEDLEADWHKLAQWHERIRHRDFFAASGRDPAAEALRRGHAALEAFTNQVYAREEIGSAWLIRRFVDIEAEFAFVPRDTPVRAVVDGTPFYLPDAVLTKRDGHSTFEAILDAYDLAERDSTLVELGHILRVVDEVHGPVAFRGVPLHQALPPDAPPETAGLQTVLHGVRLLSSDDQTAITAAMTVLDSVYAALQARREKVADR